MKCWSRNDTKKWITQVEQRVDDLEYYSNKTLEWCENNYITDNKKIFLCSFMTLIWVANMRYESISYRELFEILGLEESTTGDDKVYDLGPDYCNLDHTDILKMVISNATDYLPE